MTDLGAFQRMLAKTLSKTMLLEGDELRTYIAKMNERSSRTTWVPLPAMTAMLVVNPGEVGHFEACFDRAGNLLSIGQELEPRARVNDLDGLMRMVAQCRGASMDLLMRGMSRYRDHFDGAEWVPQSRADKVLRVNPGSRAHFEAEFDGQGNILSIGQWESL